MKQHLLAAGPELLKAGASSPTLTGGVVGEDEIWACTTCRACQEVCPVSIEPMTKLIDLRRSLVMEQAAMPESAEVALRSIEDRGHPWRGTTATRTDWAEGLNIRTLAEDSHTDILYWVGCTEALEERSMKVARSVAKLLKLAGVNFAILGAEESCCGEPARRLGNEYLFQTQVARNIEILKSYNVKRIVTACPHCYNTLQNEYPQFGGEFEVSHHTQFIAALFQEGRLGVIKGLKGIVTYQDPCYLGRYNDIYLPPRQILSHMPDLTPVEMKPNKTKSFCCGGGGGRMWLEEAAGQRVSELRLEQVMTTQASVIATACPYCLQMLDDAIRTKEMTESLRVKDIAELVSEAALYRPYPEASD
jgi:Fe-S oxidoreductase